MHETIESSAGPMHGITLEESTEQTALAELQPRLEELRRVEQVGGWYYDRVRQVSWCRQKCIACLDSRRLRSGHLTTSF